MIEGRCQVFAPAAVPLVQPDGVEPRPPGFVCDAQHVVGLTASFEPMDEDERGMFVAVLVPMAITQDPGFWGDAEESRFDRKSRRPPGPGPEAREQRHHMRVSEEGMGDEFSIFDLSDHWTGNLRQADQKRKRRGLSGGGFSNPRNRRWRYGHFSRPLQGSVHRFGQDVEREPLSKKIRDP